MTAKRYWVGGVMSSYNDRLGKILTPAQNKAISESRKEAQKLKKNLTAGINWDFLQEVNKVASFDQKLSAWVGVAIRDPKIAADFFPSIIAGSLIILENSCRVDAQ